jgi:hypothetical protein
MGSAPSAVERLSRCGETPRLARSREEYADDDTSATRYGTTLSVELRAARYHPSEEVEFGERRATETACRRGEAAGRVWHFAPAPARPPRLIPLIGLAGAPLFLTAATATLVGVNEPASIWTALATIPIFVWELSLGVWLVLKGFKPLVVTPGVPSGAVEK